MFALTVSTAEQKNIKEAMADSAWIEAIQEELHQFDRLQVWELVDKPFGKTVIRLKWLWKKKKDEDQTAKYALKILLKHGMDKGQSIGTPIATKPKLDADLSVNPIDQTDYRSKIRSLMYLTSSRPDIVQANYTAMSSTEAEYVALFTSCAQVIWMRTQLQDYGFNYNKNIVVLQLSVYHINLMQPRTALSYQAHPYSISLHKGTALPEDRFKYLVRQIGMRCLTPAELESTISISCNPVQHSRNKHIHTQYHFIKEQVENGIIELYFVITEYQSADMFTKALPEDRFKYLVRQIGMRCLTPAELEGNPQQALKDKGFIDSGCSWHMTRNISYLSDFEEINGGYVAFGRNPKGGKITSKGTKREFSVARTPQQHGITERKNMTLIEAPRTMLVDSLLPIPFWVEAVNNACYVQHRLLVSIPYNKTAYELLLGRTPSIGFMRPFGCLVTILNTLDPLGKFDRKVDEGFLVGYSVNSKDFRVFNSRTRIVQETLHKIILENQPNVVGSGPTWLFDIDTLTKSMNYQPIIAGNIPNSSAGLRVFCFHLKNEKPKSKGVFGIRVDKIICDLNKHPTCLNDPLRIALRVETWLMVIFVKDVLFYERNLRKPFVVNQDPDKNSSQSPPQINHHCCYGCGDSLEDIFCHQCTYELCGQVSHYGYSCPPKVLIIPDPEPFNNQTIDELPQTVPIFDLTCYSGEENSFTYDSKSNLVHDSPNVFDPPPQPPLYSCEFCGNDARYGHYCTPQVPFIYLELCYNQDFNFP
nr:retrovirus-related Pol polyprotein from transposon TNT 1-94 [Tanacetum cinerariifolium]